MRFIVYGAGAIGGTIGARLHQSRHDVELIARGAHADALQRDGLRLETPGDTVTLAIPTRTGPEQIEWDTGDVVVLAVKSQDTAEAAQRLALAAGTDVAVVAAQNGVANERTLSRWFGRVYGMCVMCPATNLRPGAVVASSVPITGLLDLGRFPSGVDDTSEQVASALERSTFLSVPRPDIMRWKYRKLIMNLGNAVQALCGTSAPTETRRAITALVEAEADACLAAAGIDVVSVEEDKARRADHLQLQRVAGRARSGGSTWQSLARGTGAVETDYLNGEVVLLGRLNGVPAPVNGLLQRLANEAAAARTSPGSMTDDELLARLRSVAAS